MGVHLLETEGLDFAIRTGFDAAIPGSEPAGPFQVVRVEYYVNQELVSREDYLALLETAKAEMQIVRLNSQLAKDDKLETVMDNLLPAIFRSLGGQTGG